MADRVDALDWDAIAAGLDDVGVAAMGTLLGPVECSTLSALYDDPGRFRSTIDMARHRYGRGQYRYFAHPLPDLVTELRTAFWPRLLPIAREWAARRGDDAPWPDDFGEWIETCHRAGQTRPTPLMLRYGAQDWNALHRDLYGELVFPLQVVIGLDEPGVDYTGGEFVVVEQRPRAQSARVDDDDRAWPWARVHHTRPSDPNQPWLVPSTGTPRRQHRARRAPNDARPDLPRRHLSVDGDVMPRMNRVDPFGDLHAAPERGLFTGNRGCLVDDDRQVVRHHRGPLWIICRTHFRGWTHPLDAPHRWTPLFFLDDAVALAAGHRPCGLCRRADHLAYRAAVTVGSGRPSQVSAADLNRMLASERLRRGRGLHRAEDRVLWRASFDDLPIGTVVLGLDGSTPHLVGPHGIHRFGFGGWEAATRPHSGVVDVLTPPTSVLALANGFTPVLHPTAITPPA